MARAGKRPRRPKGPVVERAYVKVRGCLMVSITPAILGVVIVGAVVGALYLKNPGAVRYFAGRVMDKVGSFLFPPVEGLEEIPEPFVYLGPTDLEYCGRDYTPSLPALRALFDRAGEVSPKESSRNILDSMVELELDGEEFCSGLMVTTDGFVVTAHHCLERYELAWSIYQRGQEPCEVMDEVIQELCRIQVVGRRGPLGPIDKGFLATYPVYDLAMIRAEVDDRESRPVLFNWRLDDPGIGDPVRLAGFRDDALMTFEGIVLAPTLEANYIDNAGAEDHHPRVMEDILFTNLYIEGGFSGGVIMDESGALVGTNAWGTGFMISDDDLASGHAKARHIDTLVRRVYDELHRTDTSECSPERWKDL